MKKLVAQQKILQVEAAQRLSRQLNEMVLKRVQGNSIWIQQRQRRADVLYIAYLKKT